MQSGQLLADEAAAQLLGQNIWQAPASSKNTLISPLHCPSSHLAGSTRLDFTTLILPLPLSQAFSKIPDFTTLISPLHCPFPSHRQVQVPAEQTVSVGATLGVNFLNDSFGRWERVVDPWHVQLHMSDTMDPVFRDNMTR